MSLFTQYYSTGEVQLTTDLLLLFNAHIVWCWCCKFACLAADLLQLVQYPWSFGLPTTACHKLMYDLAQAVKLGVWWFLCRLQYAGMALYNYI